MNDARAMSESQKLGEMGNGKRTGIIVIAVLVIAALIGYLVVGFRGRHIARNAAALSAPVVVPKPDGKPHSVAVPEQIAP